jgi:hypothetical protein
VCTDAAGVAILTKSPEAMVFSAPIPPTDGGLETAVEVTHGKTTLGLRARNSFTPVVVTPLPSGQVSIDEWMGVTAHVGAGKERRALGEPIALGDNWPSLFAQAPRVALGCLDGSCTFRELEIVADRGE